MANRFVTVRVCVYMYIAIIMCEGEHWSVAKLLCVLLIVIAVVHALGQHQQCGACGGVVWVHGVYYA